MTIMELDHMSGSGTEKCEASLQLTEQHDRVSMEEINWAKEVEG